MLVLTVLLVTTFVYLFPPGYKAEAKVLVEPSKSPTLRTETRHGGDIALVLYTEIEIVTSRAVVEAVVDQLHLDQNPLPSTTIARMVTDIRSYLEGVGLIYPISDREKAINGLMKDVKVKPVLDTNVFSIRYSDQDAVRAAAIVNAVANEYLALRQRIYSYADALATLRENAEAAEQELARLVGELERQKEDDPSLLALDATREALVLEASRIRDRLGEERLELTALRTRFSEDHQNVRLVRGRMAGLKSQLEEIGRELKRVEAGKNIVDTLQAGINRQQQTVVAYKQQYDQAVPNSIAEQALTNVHILNLAVPPARPRFPRLFYIVVALFLGSLFSLLIALLREYFDYRVDRPERVEELLGVPVIGSVPVARASVRRPRG